MSCLDFCTNLAFCSLLGHWECSFGSTLLDYHYINMLLDMDRCKFVLVSFTAERWNSDITQFPPNICNKGKEKKKNQLNGTKHSCGDFLFSSPLTTSATLQVGSMLPMCFGWAGFVSLPNRRAAHKDKGWGVGSAAVKEAEVNNKHTAQVCQTHCAG